MSDKSSGHTGGYSEPVHGTTETGRDVTAAFGHGTKGGHTMLSDGHKSPSEFWGDKGNKGHDHYGSGNGRNNNGTSRGMYNGTGSGTDKGTDCGGSSSTGGGDAWDSYSPLPF